MSNNLKELVGISAVALALISAGGLASSNNVNVHADDNDDIPASLPASYYQRGEIEANKTFAKAKKIDDAYDAKADAEALPHEESYDLQQLKNGSVISSQDYDDPAIRSYLESKGYTDAQLNPKYDSDADSTDDSYTAPKHIKSFDEIRKEFVSGRLPGELKKRSHFNHNKRRSVKRTAKRYAHKKSNKHPIKRNHKKVNNRHQIKRNHKRITKKRIRKVNNNHKIRRRSVKKQRNRRTRYTKQGQVRINFIKGTNYDYRQGKNAGRKYAKYYISHGTSYMDAIKSLAKMNNNKLFNKKYVNGFDDGSSEIDTEYVEDEPSPVDYDSLMTIAQQYKASHYNSKLIRVVNHLINDSIGEDGTEAQEYAESHPKYRIVANAVGDLIDMSILN